MPSTLAGKDPKNHSATLIAAGVVIALLYFGKMFFVTLITSVTISFLLEPFVALLMKIRFPRSLASLVVCAVSVLLLYLIGFGLYTQALDLADELPSYGNRISQLSDEVRTRMEAAEARTMRLLTPSRPVAALPPALPKRNRRAADPMPAAPTVPTVQEVRIQSERSIVLNYFYQNWESMYHTALLFSFVPFLVYFMLSWQDHMRKAYLQMFHGTGRHAAGRSWQGIGDMARAYLVGNFVLGILLTFLSGCFFWWFGVPYFLLVAPLSALFSLVPYVGMPLAILPPVMAALPVYGKVTDYLIIAFVVGFLHLLALNLLYPKLVGSRVHLNPLAVTVALMFWGSLWGSIGLLFAIPITAGMKAVFDNVPRFQPYGKILGD